MKPEAQRIAIAEVCGWINSPTNDHAWRRPFVHHEELRRVEFDGLPDYLNDLNAMRAAEEVLTRDQHQKFRNELAGICGFNYNRPSESVPDHHRQYVSSKASERAEALLRALGNWEDDK